MAGFAGIRVPTHPAAAPRFRQLGDSSGAVSRRICAARLNAPQRPSQPPQRDDLLFLFFAQDIAHVTERNLSVQFNVPIQLSRWPVFRCPHMAGFG